MKPAKRLAPGDVVRFGDEGKVCFLGQLDATVEEKAGGGEVTLAFAFHGPVLDQALDERGDMPLPPYIAASTPDERDRTDYQTMFAREEGSVAAPTAGLHFTDALTARLLERGDYACTRSRCMWARGRFFRSSRTTPPRIACMRSKAASTRRPRLRSTGAAGGRPHRRGRLDFAAAS